ncbi:MAG: 4Fe-4S binding protein [Phaeovulum sp.]|uniref:NosR/NirI family protein n=1 Tax=Phaeovulum sp. TaxID=2934796 RepID=UPI00272F8210|nr:NosR/NirI family protein [Phaeovulum sp.]MDP2064065.1 4Fe-4S binding protein [Phaeovulum sp.]
MHAVRFARSFGLGTLLSALLALVALALPAAAQSEAPLLPDFIALYPAGKLVPGAEAYGPMRDDIPVVPLLKGSETIGYAFMNSDLVGAIGYSSRPIHILAAVSPDAVVLGAAMLQQSEPLLQSGKRATTVKQLVASYAGRDLKPEAVPGGTGKDRPYVSGVSVSVRVIEDSIIRAGLKVAFTLGLGGLEMPARPPGTFATVNPEAEAPATWQALLDAGLLRQLRLTNAQLNQDFAAPGQPPNAAKFPARGAADELFIDLYASDISVPGIAAQLLRGVERTDLFAMVEAGGAAIVVAARGDYSWRGSNYRYDGLFDRIALVQGDKTIRFNSRDQMSIYRLAVPDTPILTEISLLAIPAFAEFDPTQPWRLELLVERRMGAIERTYLTYGVDFALPANFITPAVMTVAQYEQAAERAAVVAMRNSVWQNKSVELAGLAVMLAVLTAAFFFQSYLTRSAGLTFWFRIGYLGTTLAFLGWYSNAQLSIVNLMALASSLQSGFDWETFLMDPMAFILWFSVAAALIFWGRGAYCGWLCPFGAMQELTNRLAKALHIPQWTLPWGLHERLWAVKYIIFLGLFGATLTSLDTAIRYAEVEPFRTAITLKFARAWPYTLYLSVLLFIGLFVERFFCRYLCPLGAALAIPARIRMFDWIKRYRECGSPCQICSNECMVQSIHPTGEINPNECLSCLHCQVQYQSKSVCPVVIKQVKRREKVAQGVHAVEHVIERTHHANHPHAVKVAE